MLDAHRAADIGRDEAGATVDPGHGRRGQRDAAARRSGWRQRRRRHILVEVRPIAPIDGRDRPRRIAAAGDLARRVIRMDDIERVGRLHEPELEQRGFGPGRDDLDRCSRRALDARLAAIDPHGEVGELKHVGLLGVELKAEQARRAVALGLRDVARARPLGHRAFDQRQDVAQLARSVGIALQVDAAIEPRRPFSGVEVSDDGSDARHQYRAESQSSATNSADGASDASTDRASASSRS